MATGGWGAAGAWGATPKTAPEYDELEEGPPAQAAQPIYNSPPAASYDSSANKTYGAASDAPPAASAFYPSAKPEFGSSSNGNTGREAELNRREKELNAKEKALKELEQQLKDHGVVLKKKNWPFFLPLLHHDISGEIPEKSRRVVREIYGCWWALSFCLFWNFFAASTVLGTSDPNRIASWFLSIFFAVLGIPLAFWGWYLSIYDAGATDSTYGMIKFFFCFFINICWCIWCAVGPQLGVAKWSFAGWLTCFEALGQTTFIGIIYIVGACLWTAISAYCVWCFIDAYFFFRGKGGVKEVKKAKEDAAVEAFRVNMQNQQGGATSWKV